VGPMGHFDKFKPGKTAPSCDYVFLIFTLWNRHLSWMFHMCFRCRQQLQLHLNGEKLVVLSFSKKREVSILSVLTGNKEVKMKVAYFGGTYDYCRLRRADYDVIT